MTKIYTPENLTWEDIKSWDGATFKDQRRRDGMRDAIDRIVASRNFKEVEEVAAQIQSRTAPVEVPAEAPTEVPGEKSPEQLAAEQEAAQAAAQYEAERAAAAEAQRLADEAARKAAEQPRKFVADYQIKDEDGNPIGRPTHLEAPTQEELQAKLIEAHTQATRAFHRLKKQKVSFKEQQEPPQIPASMTDSELLAAMKDLKSDDPQKQLDALRKVQKSEADRVRIEKDAEKAQLEELNRQQRVSFQFRSRHQHDFNNCKANIKLIQDYFEENQLAWTLDNLEIAFHALESELAPVVSVAPAAPANPQPAVPVASAVPPAAPATVTPAAPAAVQPPATAPAQPAATTNSQPATPRPGVNAGGMVPGQSSASRPATTAPKGLTDEEVNSWDGPTMKAKMRDPRVRPQIEAWIKAKNERRQTRTT